MKSNCSRAQMVGLLDTTSCVLQTDQRWTQVKNKIPTAVLHADDLAASCLWGALPEGAQQWAPTQTGNKDDTYLVACVLSAWYMPFEYM
jgi:hypothetical protein